jgi:hypothetical protein
MQNCGIPQRHVPLALDLRREFPKNVRQNGFVKFSDRLELILTSREMLFFYKRRDAIVGQRVERPDSPGPLFAPNM